MLFRAGLALSVTFGDTSPKGRGFGIPEGAKNPLSERQLREGVFFCFGEHHEYSYLLCFYYMPFPAKVKRCTESLQAHQQVPTTTARQYSRPATVLWQTPTRSLVVAPYDTSLP